MAKSVVYNRSNLHLYEELICKKVSLGGILQQERGQLNNRLAGNCGHQ